jgi:hypothetical protein
MYPSTDGDGSVIDGSVVHKALSRLVDYQHPGFKCADRRSITGGQDRPPLYLTGFMTKLPCWPASSWLPLAHVESSTAGSVILACIYLKVGIVLLVRVLFRLRREMIQYP